MTTTTSGVVVLTDVTTSSSGTTSSTGTRVMTYTGGFLAGTSSTLSVFGTADGCVWDFRRRFGVAGVTLGGEEEEEDASGIDGKRKSGGGEMGFEMKTKEEK